MIPQEVKMAEVKLTQFLIGGLSGWSDRMPLLSELVIMTTSYQSRKALFSVPQYSSFADGVITFDS